MATRADAYVDTSALIALADRSDSHHEAFRALFSRPPHLVTTTLVIAEGHGWFLRRFDRARAARFLDMVGAMLPLRITAVGREEQAAGTALLRRFADQDLTLTDAIGLHVAVAHRVRSMWSTDFHLGLAGIPLVVATGQAAGP